MLILIVDQTPESGTVVWNWISPNALYTFQLQQFVRVSQGQSPLEESATSRRGRRRTKTRAPTLSLNFSELQQSKVHHQSISIFPNSMLEVISLLLRSLSLILVLPFEDRLDRLGFSFAWSCISFTLFHFVNRTLNAVQLNPSHLIMHRLLFRDSILVSKLSALRVRPGFRITCSTNRFSIIFCLIPVSANSVLFLVFSSFAWEISIRPFHPLDRPHIFIFRFHLYQVARLV